MTPASQQPDDRTLPFNGLSSRRAQWERQLLAGEAETCFSGFPIAGIQKASNEIVIKHAAGVEPHFCARVYYPDSIEELQAHYGS